MKIQKFMNRPEEHNETNQKESNRIRSHTLDDGHRSCS
jgi:hypothetical protein